jgi:hypothetical protein
VATMKNKVILKDVLTSMADSQIEQVFVTDNRMMLPRKDITDELLQCPIMGVSVNDNSVVIEIKKIKNC